MTTQRHARRLVLLLLAVLLGAGLLPRAPHAVLAQPSQRSAAQDSLGLDWGMYDLPGGVRNVRSLALGDLDGDGDLDLVRAHSNGSEVLLGYGNGTFGLPLQIAGAGINTYSVALGDLDGDGKLDLICGNYQQPSTVFLGQGNGLFLQQGTLPGGGPQTRGLALGDLDGDGDLDLVRGNVGTSEVLLGDGKGAFGAPISLPGDPRNTWSVTLADLNGDGKLDLIRGNENATSQVLLGRGHGTFTLLNQEIPGGYIPTIALGDLNGDGVLDLVGNNQAAPSWATLGQGNGLFGMPIKVPRETRNTASAALGDLNGDGLLDLVRGNNGLPTELLLGQGNGQFSAPIEFPGGPRSTSSVVLGDLNGDGVLDVIRGDRNRATEVLLRQEPGQFAAPALLPGDDTRSRSVVLGDLNGDGVLDLVRGQSRRSGYPDRPSDVLLGQGNGQFLPPVDLPGDPRDVRSLALGDLDGDGDLDLVRASNGFSEVLLGDGKGRFGAPLPIAGEKINTYSVVLGDLDGDGVLDLIRGNYNQSTELLKGLGNGLFGLPITLPGGARFTQGVALGDVNNDGKLDLVRGNENQASEVLLGTGGFFQEPIPLPPDLNGNWRDTWSVTLADLNGDGKLDLIRGNENAPSQALLGQGNGTFTLLGDIPGGNIPTISLGDLNGDGVLDLVGSNYSAASQVVLGLGNGSFGAPIEIPGGARSTFSTALGDLNGDGVLDLVRGNDTRADEVLLGRRNQRFVASALAAAPGLCRVPPGVVPSDQDLPRVQVFQPGPALVPSPFALPTIHSGSVISIPYSLTAPLSPTVVRVQGFYSLDGGGTWQPATPSAATERCHQLDQGVRKRAVFGWQRQADGVTGRYEQVLFRVEVLPVIYNRPNQAVAPYRFGLSMGSSGPFRVWGLPVRVLKPDGSPVEQALIYRLAGDQVREGQRFPPQTPGSPQWLSDAQGFLKGHGVLTPTDQLLALAPISATNTYTLYYTSAPTTIAGFDLHTITASGVQTLTVKPEHPLILFNLDVSLEWDARADSAFRTQFEANLKRASELLFRWSSGQIALGDLRVFNNAEHWNDAHIRVYATNRLRPNAAQGGIVSAARPDPLHPEQRYLPGKLRIGAVWDRYGDSKANLGEDWARTLAHELGHYALFLNDNYLGKDAQGRLIGLSGCRSPMTDPYRDDYGAFHPSGPEWERDCKETLSQIENGRSDWATITSFYTKPGFRLNEPTQFDAQAVPTLLPMAFTQVLFAQSFASTTTPPLSQPMVLLTDEQGRALTPSRQARAVLYQGDRLIDLGAPTQNQLLARGARPGDMVCVYDFTQTTRVGCATLGRNYQALALKPLPDWRPNIQITGVTSRSLEMRLETTLLTPTLQLTARFYPSELQKLDPIPLTYAGTSGDTAIYTGSVPIAPVPNTSLQEGFLRVWALNDPAADTPHELVVDLRVGGHGAVKWNNGGAPVLSPDGQATLYTPEQAPQDGQFYVFQVTDNPPAAPSWATPVGRAYLLNGSADLVWDNSSVSFSYLSQDVGEAQEDGIRVFFWQQDPHGQQGQWQPLDTALDTAHNQASVRVDRPGLYMLMSSAQVVLDSPGWNLVYFYPGVTQAVTEAVDTLLGEFTSIYGYSDDPRDAADPWRIYDRTVPEAWSKTVNDLDTLAHGDGYWIYATRPVSWFVRNGAGAPSTQARSLHAPPATYYGLAPAKDLTVQAMVGNQRCGGSTTVERQIDGRLRPVFVIKVQAAGAGVDCGLPERPVTLLISDGTRVVAHLLTTWDNRQAHYLNTQPIYLPLVQR